MKALKKMSGWIGLVIVFIVSWLIYWEFVSPIKRELDAKAWAIAEAAAEPELEIGGPTIFQRADGVNVTLTSILAQLAESRSMYETWRAAEAEAARDRILVPGILRDGKGEEHPIYFHAWRGEVSMPDPQEAMKAIQLDSLPPEKELQTTSQSRCPECRKEGRISIVTEGELDRDDSFPETNTFYGIDGRSHLHGSRLFRNYLCSSGHQWREMLCRTCWCGWVYPDGD